MTSHSTDRPLHDWDVSTDRAREIQLELRDRVDFEPIDRSVECVAGADVSFSRGSDDIYAAVVALDADSLEPISVGRARGEAAFPYVPSYLSFREAPAVLEAYGDLDVDPDALICDGHGYAHPRRFGLACHVGLWLDVPTVGSAKNVLVGDFDPPAPDKGSHSPLRHEGETVGRAVRTRTDVQPVFVSVGHRSDLESATDLVLSVSPRYKIPEPIRAAHRTVNEMRRDA